MQKPEVTDLAGRPGGGSESQRAEPSPGQEDMDKDSNSNQSSFKLRSTFYMKGEKKAEEFRYSVESKKSVHGTFSNVHDAIKEEAQRAELKGPQTDSLKKPANSKSVINLTMQMPEPISDLRNSLKTLPMTGLLRHQPRSNSTLGKKSAKEAQAAAAALRVKRNSSTQLAER